MDRVDEAGDGELYSSFLAGDKDAYDKLLIRHGDSLTVYLYGCLHDWDDAEDMMIEAFARIMAKRPRIKDGAFKSYLIKTARNLAIRLSERNRRFQMFSIDGMEPEMADGILNDESDAEDYSVEEDVLKEERAKAVNRCLEKIDPELRETLWLVYIEDMSYAEAAQIMGVREKRIDHLLERGKKQMRAELEKEGTTISI